MSYQFSEKSSHKCTAERQPPKPKRITDTLLWIRSNLLPPHNFWFSGFRRIYLSFLWKVLFHNLIPLYRRKPTSRSLDILPMIRCESVPICSIDTISLFIWFWLEFSFLFVKVLVHSPHNLIPNVSWFQTSWFATCSSLTKVTHCIQH